MGKLGLPPAAPPQFPGFVPLALDLLLAEFDNEWGQNIPPSPAVPVTTKFYKDERDEQDENQNRLWVKTLSLISFILSIPVITSL